MPFFPLRGDTVRHPIDWYPRTSTMSMSLHTMPLKHWFKQFVQQSSWKAWSRHVKHIFLSSNYLVEIYASCTDPPLPPQSPLPPGPPPHIADRLRARKALHSSLSSTKRTPRFERVSKGLKMKCCRMKPNRQNDAKCTAQYHISCFCKQYQQTRVTMKYGGNESHSSRDEEMDDTASTKTTEKYSNYT